MAAAESGVRQAEAGVAGQLAALGRAEAQRAGTHLSRAHFFGVLLRAASGVPCVATAQSRHFQLHWMFNDLVIAVSEATRLYHQRWNRVPSERILTIPNFVDSD